MHELMRFKQIRASLDTRDFAVVFMFVMPGKDIGSRNGMFRPRRSR